MKDQINEQIQREKLKSNPDYKLIRKLQQLLDEPEKKSSEV